MCSLRRSELLIHLTRFQLFHGQEPHEGSHPPHITPAHFLSKYLLPTSAGL